LIVHPIDRAPGLSRTRFIAHIADYELS